MVYYNKYLRGCPYDGPTVKLHSHTICHRLAGEALRKGPQSDLPAPLAQKSYVLKRFGLKGYTFYISQVKWKCGLEVG